MFGIRKLSRRGLDVEISTGCGVTVRILERPGLWMAPGPRGRLLAEMREVAARGTDGEPLAYGILSGDLDRWESAILTVLRDSGSRRLVGFSAMSLLDVDVGGRSETVLHLGLLMLDPGYRGRGFSRLVYGMSTVLALLRRCGRSFWVSSVSQVPAVVGMVSKSLEDPFPAPTAVRTHRHLEVAREIMARHRAVFGVGEEAGFDAERFVITDAYTGGSDNLKKSFFEAPKHRDPAINAWCRETLDYGRGDDVLQLARFTPRVARRCLGRFLVRSSVLAPFLRGVRGLLRSEA